MTAPVKTTIELVRAAVEGRRIKRAVPFPGMEGHTIAVRVLTDVELDGCHRRAAEYCGKIEAVIKIDPDIFDRALRREVVEAAFFQSVDSNDSFFESSEQVGELDDQTVIALHALYYEHRDLVAPWQSMDEKEVDEYVKLLGKSETTVDMLSLFAFRTQQSLLLSMARRLRAQSATSKSSTG